MTKYKASPGFVPIFILLGVMIVGLTSASVFFVNQNKSLLKQISDTNSAALNASPITSPVSHFDLSSPTPSVISSSSPVASPKPTTSAKASVKPSVIATPKPSPTPLSTSTCSVNALPSSNNSLGLNLIAGVSTTNGRYISASQWDFDGNGTWDTDMSASQNNTDHNYSSNGTYNVKLRVKLSDGEVTNTCSKSAIVPSGASVSLTGQVYEDKNCNAVQEPNEGGIPNVTVNLIWLPDYYVYATVTSDSSGHYSYSKIISGSDYLNFSISPVAASGYKIHKSSYSTTLSSGQPSMNINLPQVPNANISQCSF